MNDHAMIAAVVAIVIVLVVAVLVAGDGVTPAMIFVAGIRVGGEGPREQRTGQCEEHHPFHDPPPVGRRSHRPAPQEGGKRAASATERATSSNSRHLATIGAPRAGSSVFP